MSIDRLTIDERFADIVAGPAAEDPELIEHFRVRMQGTDEEREDRQLADADTKFMIMVTYDLDPEAYGRAVGACVAKLAGMQVGVAGIIPKKKDRP